MDERDPATPILRLRKPEDVAEIRDLMARVYPPPHGPEAIWSAENLQKHMQYFPEGQMVVEVSGRLVGTSTTHRVPWDAALAPHTWSGITARGTLSNHEPAGEVLYGVNIAVDPEWQGRRVGSLLYKERLDLARRVGCRAFVAGARVPGYHRVAEEMTLEAYVDAVVAERLFDPTLSKQIRVGFQVRGVLRDYAPDPETLGHAALIVMEL
ncbi:GNAT family N-acetyltransferase [Geothrix sp. 21YS21S-4]|uniref:GNAT family N-acetyltransferase n=1 Tax=Geothrix sp. 21YS21S-4 TaxID=3068889 RepID=UPI0027B8DFF8|nr:GNAT family N-acetyltransferase [Geothrix sp. 21YS21S-4]